MHHSSLLAIITTMACVLLPAINADSAETHSQRWAILASPDLQQSGLADLLTVELTQRSIEQVERVAIDDINQEQQLAAAFGAAASAQRIKLGQLTKADVLMMLTTVEEAQSRFIRCVVFESRFGARLSYTLVTHQEEESDSVWLERTVQDIAGIADRTQSRFPSGVRQIVAVAPFLSKNLVHDYDHLQFGLAGLLGEALSAQSGVAVLEIEEAREISKELERTPDSIERRVVPVFVDAEFVVPDITRPAADSAAKIDIVINAHGGQTGQWKCHELAIPEAVTWLSTDVVTGLLGSGVPSQQATALTREQQWRELWTQADRFTRVGGFLEAIALREAALLLDAPFEARIQLISDYLNGETIRRNRDSADAKKTMVRSPDGTHFIGTEKTREFWKERAVAGFEHYRRCQQLIEMLLANREVNMVEGGLLWQQGLTLSRMTSGGTDSAQQFHQQQVRFYWDNIPRLQQLDPSLRDGIPHPLILSTTRTIHKTWDDSLARQSRVWSSAANTFLFSVTGPPPFTQPEDFPADSGLRGYQRLVTELHDPRYPNPSVVAASMPGNVGLMQVGYNSGNLYNHVVQKKLTEDDLVAHYQRLIDTKQPWAVFYGRAGLWGEAVRTKSLTQEEITREYKSLMQSLDELKEETPQNSDLVTDIQVVISTVHLVNEKGLGTLVARMHELSRSRNPSKSQPEPPPVRTMQVTFEEIPDTHAPYCAIERCGDGIDAVWNNDRLWLMSAVGDLTPVFERPRLEETFSRDYLQEVRCDGELLWSATAESGLRVFNLNGQLLGHLPAQPASEQDGSLSVPGSGNATLPPFRKWPSPWFQDGSFPFTPHRVTASLRILPVGERRCLVAATYGPLDRLWISLVTLAPDGTWQTRLLHQATRVAQVNDNSQFQDSHIAASPRWFARFEHPLPHPHPVALLGRNVPLTFTNAVPPLVIDLTTFEVSVLEGNFTEHGQRSVAVANGRLVQSSPHMLESIAPVQTEDGGIEWQSRQFISSPRRNFSASVDGWFINGDDMLYVATWSLWARLDTRNWVFHLGYPVPSGTRFQFQAMSSKYGLVAWNFNGPLHRVVMKSRDE